MYVEAVALGLFIGWVKKGRLGFFLRYPFRARYLSLLALILFAFPYAMCLLGISANLSIVSYIAMVLCAVIVLLNHRCVGMKTLLLGLLLNLTIMGLNNFAMPIDTDKLIELGQTSFAQFVLNGEVLNYQSMTGAQGISRWLGKVVALPPWYFHSVILSIGDIFSCIGITLVVQSAMVNRKEGMVQPSAIHWR